MADNLWWAVARSGGIVAWALLAASVLWGLALSTRALGARPRPNWLLDLHRFLGALALVFTGIHVGALVLDDWVSIGLTQILVPFTSDYRASAVAWGVVALYLLVAVEVTSLLRSRIPRSLWRRTHMLSFPLFMTSTVHGVLAGTDAGVPLFVSMLLTTAAVGGLASVRIAQAITHEPRRTPSARKQRSRLQQGTQESEPSPARQA